MDQQTETIQYSIEQYGEGPTGVIVERTPSVKVEFTFKEFSFSLREDKLREIADKYKAGKINDDRIEAIVQKRLKYLGEKRAEGKDFVEATLYFASTITTKYVDGTPGKAS